MKPLYTPPEDSAEQIALKELAAKSDKDWVIKKAKITSGGNFTYELDSKVNLPNNFVGLKGNGDID